MKYNHITQYMIMGVIICLLLSACQMDDADSIAPEQSGWRKETLDLEYVCSKCKKRMERTE